MAHSRQFKLEGMTYPGVSTILKATQSPEQLRRLAQWRERVGAAEAQRVIQESTGRGTLLHKLTETHLKGEDTAAVLAEAPPSKRPWFQNFGSKYTLFYPIWITRF